MNSDMLKKVYQPVLDFMLNCFSLISISLILSVILFILIFVLFYKVNPFKPNTERLKSYDISFKPYNLFRWVLVDIIENKNKPIEFDEFGFTIYCGRQGAGKTISMIEYLHRMKKKYPKCLIITNFQCSIADKQMNDWRDFMTIRNETDGVIFAIDEIHSEYSSDAWKDFPESLLSEISQQRKQRIKIVATSQVFSRVVKQIREQAFSVIQCKTYLKRFTCCTEYDAADYGTKQDSAYQVKDKVKPLQRYSFVQSNELRFSYDTYEKIKRMEKLTFISREKR